MKFKDKLIPSLLLILAFVIALNIKTVNASDFIPSKPSTSYYDELGVLSNSTKDEVENKNAEYSKKDKAPQVMLVVVNSSHGEGVSLYADEIILDWKLGSRDKHNGAMVLYAYNNGEQNVAIKTDYGLAQVVTDKEAKEILESNRDDLKSTDSMKLDRGLRNVYNSVTKLVDKSFSSQESGESKGIDSGIRIKFILLIVTVLIIVIFATYKFFISVYKSKRLLYWGTPIDSDEKSKDTKESENKEINNHPGGKSRKE
ncbi:TPM domain-containing protein [Xylocopilactobacillus apis]|uniref:TPM domain-containing protein n=1 Tax=Xylocopilactobacillus apis TaxID=2932183 RepID=A0AAU9CQ43_9LACO|nr:TPM domain-containing protein [Xylocopilactobacillus apis]BDR56062.1 hypothetical protein KIMC2_06240 [Xylocopilactobacillus apis]